MLGEEFLRSTDIIPQDTEGQFASIQPAGQSECLFFYCKAHTLSFDLGKMSEGVKK